MQKKKSIPTTNQSAENMNIEGQDVINSIKEWSKKEIVESPRRSFELGKFYFSVSIATIAFITGILKLSENTVVDCWLIVSLIFLIPSCTLSILLILPKKWQIKEKTDLVVIFKKKIALTYRLSIYWFCLWLLGLIAGIVSFFK